MGERTHLLQNPCRTLTQKLHTNPRQHVHKCSTLLWYLTYKLRTDRRTTTMNTKKQKKMCECNKYSYKLHLNVKIVSFGINIYITLNIFNLPRRIYGAQTHHYLSGL